MSTFVVGSKDPVIPDVSPRIIISANGAAGIFSDHIRSGTPLITIITPYLLFPDTGPYRNRDDLRAQTLKQLTKNKIDELIIRPALHLSRSDLLRSKYLSAIQAKNVKRWRYAEIFSLLCSVYGSKRILTEVWQERLLTARRINFFRTLASSEKFKISTGMMCLALAIKDDRCRPPYYVIGVGDRNGKYSYSHFHEADRSAHLTADLMMLQYLARSKLKNDIIITDSGLRDRFMRFKATAV